MNKEEINTPKVSVIIPVWNPGEGISRCVESLRSQTLSDIEMIFVDDCGTDGAMDVVRKAAKEDPRIRILTNTENMGPRASRNAGIEIASGEYLAFVDADDYVNAVFLERLYAKAIADNLDIVKGKHVYEQADGTVADYPELNESIRNGLESGMPLYVLFTYQHQSAIYRRDFLVENHIRYGNSRRGQDTTFLLKACHKAVRFGFGENAEYHYCEQNNSLVHNIHPYMFGWKLLALREKMDYIVECMVGDEWVSQYIAARVNYELGFYAHSRKRSGCRKESEGFLAGVREEVLRFPQLEKLKRESFPIYVLCEYGIGLASRPFRLPWEEMRAARYVEIIREWVDFVVAYPNMLAAAEKDLYRLFREAVSLAEMHQGQLAAMEAKRIKRALSAQAERLPRHCREQIHVRHVKFVLKKTYMRWREHILNLNNEYLCRRNNNLMP